MAMKAPIRGLSFAPSPSSSLCPPPKMVLVRCPPLRTSFFNGGVGKLKVMGVQTFNCNALKCVGRGGGALGAQMNLFDRLARVIKSYANAILSSVEDPEKILDQAVLEMNDDLTKMRQATAQVLASQKRMENKYKAAQQASDDWYRRAQLALEKGDENLAREALKRRKSYADNANSLKAQLDQQKSVVDNLVSNTRLLESKIQEARSKKDTLKARAQSAKTATKVSELLGNVNTSSALSAFEKMEEKVMAMESQAEALNQLTSDDLEGKFALLESSSVDDDLAKLKRELSGTSLDRCPLITRISNYPYKMMIDILECLLQHDLIGGLPKKINPVGINFINFKIGSSYCCMAVLLWVISKLNSLEVATWNIVEETRVGLYSSKSALRKTVL